MVQGTWNVRGAREGDGGGVGSTRIITQDTITATHYYPRRKCTQQRNIQIKHTDRRGEKPRMTQHFASTKNTTLFRQCDNSPLNSSRPICGRYIGDSDITFREHSNHWSPFGAQLRQDGLVRSDCLHQHTITIGLAIAP